MLRPELRLYTGNMTVIARIVEEGHRVSIGRWKVRERRELEVGMRFGAGLVEKHLLGFNYAVRHL